MVPQVKMLFKQTVIGVGMVSFIHWKLGMKPVLVSDVSQQGVPLTRLRNHSVVRGITDSFRGGGWLASADAFDAPTRL
jgi:hypothetical protein